VPTLTLPEGTIRFEMAVEIRIFTHYRAPSWAGLPKPRHLGAESNLPTFSPPASTTVPSDSVADTHQGYSYLLLIFTQKTAESEFAGLPTMCRRLSAPCGHSPEMAVNERSGGVSGWRASP